MKRLIFILVALSLLSGCIVDQLEKQAQTKQDLIFMIENSWTHKTDSNKEPWTPLNLNMPLDIFLLDILDLKLKNTGNYIYREKIKPTYYGFMSVPLTGREEPGL